PRPRSPREITFPSSHEEPKFEGLDPKRLLVFSRKVEANQDWTPDEESTFWLDVAALARELHPVSYETLTSSRTRAKMWAIFFGVLCVVLLALLLYYQFVWVVVNNVSQNVDRLLVEYSAASTESDALHYRLEAAKHRTQRAPKAPTGEGAAGHQDEENDAGGASQGPTGPAEAGAGGVVGAPDGQMGTNTVKDELQTITQLADENERKRRRIERRRAASMQILERWLPATWWMNDDDDLFAALRRDQRQDTMHAWAKQVLQGMSGYFLPLLYGLLGACAFILRSISRQIRERTFSTTDSVVQYMLRLVLGGLSGIAVGWFLRPDDVGAEIVSSISPLALAFVAGYSVELLFTAMDTVIAAFTRSAPRPAK
ncbi:MAG: hypothetical protein OXU20_21480, partial [Myxococcales bacterium]|nr:hypothetical protein [Myxococcales bacterium]